MALATLISRILGLVREQCIAYFFGASGSTDAYYVAFRIPNLLRDLLAEGAFSASFVPSFVKENQKDPKAASRLLCSLFFLLATITGLLALVFYFTAPQIISLFAPSFKEDPAKFALTVRLTQIMSPYLLFVSLAALMMGALNSLKVYFVPALSPALFNVAMIISITVFSPWFVGIGESPILSLAYGVLIGGALQYFLQFPLVLRRGYFSALKESFWNPEAIRVFKKLGPGLVGFAATQINLLVTTILATGSIVGAVSYLSYSFRLFQLPVGILGVSLGNSNLVHFADLWSAEKKEEASNLLRVSFFTSLFIMIPVAAFSMVKSFELVRLIFEHGEFGSLATQKTSLALICYSIGLPSYGLYKLLVPVFYALDKEKIPVFVSIFSIGVNLVFCLGLVKVLGFWVLALGTSLSMMINSGLLIIFLKKELKLESSWLLNSRVFKILMGSLFAAVAAFYLPSFGRGLLLQLGHLVVSLVLFFGVYSLILILGGEKKLLRRVARKFFPRKSG